jgi:ADP-ribose pyrophosphatase YjhB (NUDIX family)
VGAVIWRGNKVLLIRRANPPFAGAWSIPGGRQEPGETVKAALLREIGEETGLTVEITSLIDIVDGIFTDADGGLTHHYTLIDYSARWLSGEAKAGGDAAALAWIHFADVAALDLWSETRRIIEMSAARHGPASPSPC